MARRRRRILAIKTSVLSLTAPSIASSAPAFPHPPEPGCIFNVVPGDRLEVIASNTSADQVLWVDNVAMENY